MATFGLVHGAWHGAWCWERLVPELEVRGHAAVAVDLPADDPHAGLERYADKVAAALVGQEDVVLVGHSLAGHVVPFVPFRRPVRHLVFLCAVVPVSGYSLTDLYEREDVFVPGFAGHTAVRDDDGASYWRDLDAAKRLLFHDSTAEDAEWASRQLRPQPPRPRTQPFPLAAVPNVERTLILGRDERVVSPDWSRRVARSRLGVEPVELPGGHSPFLARPAELANLLARLA